MVVSSWCRRGVVSRGGCVLTRRSVVGMERGGGGGKRWWW